MLHVHVQFDRQTKATFAIAKIFPCEATLHQYSCYINNPVLDSRATISKISWQSYDAVVSYHADM
jgi:hypothetical protein